MKDTVQIEELYSKLLQEYVAGAQEVALARAYELGRQAVAEGRGVLEVAAVHHKVLTTVLTQARTSESSAQLTRAAADVFAEVLGPFEMVQRGFQEANQALRELNETLEQQVGERTREIARQLEHLTALRTIDMAITGSMDLRVTLNIVLDQVTTQLGVDAASVLLLDSNAQTLQFAANRGFRTRATQHTSLRMGEGYAGRCALERRTLIIPNLPDALNKFSESPQFPAEGFVAYCAVPLIAKGQVKGVLEIFHRTPLAIGQEWQDFLEALGGQAAIAIDNASLFDSLQRVNTDLTLAYDSTLEGWSRALDLRDKETEGHTQRVSELTLRLARVMSVPDGELVHIRRGALLHDIGKMAIPDSILLKPGPLTEEEWEVMRKHPVYAHRLLSPIPYLHNAIDIPYCHHEKWDGTGYPRGLKGDQIPLAARIFAVVDVWDALRSDRPYRRAWPEEKAREYIREQADKHFDPKVVAVFLTMETIRR